MVFPHAYRTEHTETHTTNAEYGDYYARVISKKIKIQPALIQLLHYVDSNNGAILKDLADIVAIRSHWPPPAADDVEFVKAKTYIEDWMRRLGAKFESFSLGAHRLADGSVHKLPVVTLSTCRGQPGITVAVYCHADVRQPDVDGGWRTDPWTATVVGRDVYGNGVTHGKGALMCWLQVVNAFQRTGIQLPVTVKLIVEGMHYNRSVGLKDFLMTQKQIFLHDIDFIVVCDAEWFDDRYPCITYGCVGFIHFDVVVTTLPTSGQTADDNLDAIFAHICDGDTVRIPLFDKFVVQVTPDEENLYESIRLNWDEYRKQLPAERQDWSKTKLLMHYWRMPTIFVDRSETCTCEKKDATKVKRHFIIKLVPKQSPSVVGDLVKNHILQLAKTLKMRNTIDVEYMCDTRPWMEDCTSVNYEAARRATLQIYKEDPGMIRADKDLKCLNILEMIDKNILLLPLATKSSNPGGDNEHMPLKNVYENIKLIAAYLFQLRQLVDAKK